MNRWVTVGLAALCAGIGVTSGCRPTDDTQIVLKVWGVSLGPNDKGQADVFREFERRNPGIKVQALMMGSGGMNPQKLMTAIVGGVPPDVVYQDRFTLADWAARGAFRPLDGLIQRDLGNDPACPNPDDYFPATWDEASFQGKVYGVPWMADTRTLTWNRSAFRERAPELRRAGLDPDRPPRTWSETLAYSRALTEKNPDGTLKRAGFIPNFGNSWFFLFATQNEAALLSPDGRRCTLNSPEAVAAIEFVKECYDILGGIENADRFASTFRGEAQDAFFTGQVAMKIDGDWALGGVARFAPQLDFGAAPPPVPDDRFHRRGRFKDVKDTFVSWAGGFAYSIPKGAKHEEAAWKFVKFVTSLEGRMMEVRQQDDLNRARGQMTFPRLTAHRPTNEQSLREYLPKNPNLAAAVKEHFEILPASRVRPVTFAGQALWDESNRATDNALRGVKPIGDCLQDGQDKVQRLLDEVFEKEKFPVADLRVPTWCGLGALVLGLAAFWWHWRRAPLGRVGRQEAFWGYLFVSPWILGFVVLTLGPMVASIVLSFTQFNGIQEARWVGTANYAAVAGQDRELLMKAFSNAFYLGGIGVPLGLVTGLSLALMLNGVQRGAAFFRTAFYLPSVVPGVATVVLWMWILSPDPKMGLVNGLWQATVSQWFGVPTPGWVATEAWAKPALIFMGLSGAGAGVIVWLAGLRGVPKELYEASDMDGASPWAQFWSVTLPQLSPLIFFNTVTGVIGSLQVFDSVFVVTKGYGSGPNDSLLVPVYQLFTNAFTYFRMGYASALAWVIFLVILALTGLQFLAFGRSVHYEVED